MGSLMLATQGKGGEVDRHFNKQIGREDGIIQYSAISMPFMVEVRFRRTLPYETYAKTEIDKRD